MALTRIWNDNRPQGSVLASLIDDEIQYARQDVRERIDIEHTFPSTDTTGTGLHRVGTGRIFVDTAANATVNLETNTPTGYRVGRMQWNTDTQQFSIRTADGVTSNGPALKRFKLISVPLFFVTNPGIGGAQSQSASEIALTFGNSPSVIDFSSFPGTATGSKLEARLIIHARNLSTDASVPDVFYVRANDTFPVAGFDTLYEVATVSAVDDGAYHVVVGAWNVLDNLLTEKYLLITHIGAAGKTTELAKADLQFRINE